MEVPRKWLALETVPQVEPSLNAAKLNETLMTMAHDRSDGMDLLSKWDIFGKGNGGIIVFLVVVHPHFGGATGIFGENIPRSPGKRVGVLLPKHVTDSTARDDF